jgi:hypothetical protein
VRVGDGTGEVFSDRRPTSAVTAGISRKATSRGTSGEKSEEAIVLVRLETTPLDGRDGPLLQRCRARRYVTGHARHGPITPTDRSRQLQRRLYLAATRRRNRRFHARYDRLFRPEILWRAWQEGRAHGGAAGVEGVTIEDVERRGVHQFLEQSREDLRARTSRPQPVLRGYIPKPDGGQRP